MACGDKYAHLVRTANGLTAKRRYTGMLATEHDYARWQEAANEMVPKINHHWSKLRKAELEREQGTPLSDELRESIPAFGQAVGALPVPWDVWQTGSELLSPDARIEQAISVMILGACELEKIDEAMLSLGMTVPEVSGPRPTPGAPKGMSGIIDSLQTVAIIGLIGVAIYGTAKLVMQVRKQPAAPALEGEA